MQRHIHTPTDKYMQTHTLKDIYTYKNTLRHTNADAHKHTVTGMQKYTETHTPRHRHTQIRQAHTHAETYTCMTKD